MSVKEKLYIDVATHSINKKNEELCGDKVEVFKSDDRVIVVLADGLGSGVKANILATLTSKIAITMLKQGADIEEVIDTIMHTLPVCKVRNIAYSTFSIIEIDDKLNCKILESENPPFFFLRYGHIIEPQKEMIEAHGKKVMVSKLKLKEDDIIYLCSDGVVHAGVGNTLNFGWQWNNVANFLEHDTQKTANKLSHRLIKTCNDLYQHLPGDDTTVVTVKIRKPVDIFIFTGPPLDSTLDDSFVKYFIKGNGKKVVCGGTASQIVGRALNKEVTSNLNYIDPHVPPTGNIEGIDLVTEGVITLKRTIELIKQWTQNQESVDLTKQDGATQMFKLLVEESTHIKFWLGKAINKAHQGLDFPQELSMKTDVVKELVEVLEKAGKKAEIQYISEVNYEKV